ncbi:MAG: peptidoglycan DD-metalloendopeptidase family protein [Proteobacteria bacterium]|nr:peptidoglycan DD-metalloendopeptidase family protein [Pseudomonadota bacterium]
MHLPSLIKRHLRGTSAGTSLRLSHHHWIALTVCVLLIGVVFGLTAPDAAATRSPTLIHMDNGSERIALPLPLPPGDSRLPSATELQPWQALTVKRGDTLTLMFARNGLGGKPLQELLELGKAIEPLAQLAPGQQIKIKLDRAKQLQELTYDVDEKSLRVQRVQGRLQAANINHTLETRPAYASGVIESSLFQATTQSGMSDNMTLAMADIFGWDIDFAQDLRVGDQFAVIYQEQFVAGEKVRDGTILGAEFTNRGKTYRAMRFVDENGQVSYYTPEGLSMRKAFLRTPVKFSHISSRFSVARYHPVLHRMRAHQGVDYAASTGTPIRAASSGKIAFKGVKGGYGNTIILQHAGKYSTLYAHMSAFARGIKQNGAVQQGEIIGYVGRSGLTTGPHLHYEFRIGGIHKNPLTVALPKAEPIMAKYKPAFIAQTQRLIAQMGVFKTNTQVALNAR